MKNKILYNNQIRAKQVRLIDETGRQLGVFNLQEAIGKAKEKNLDLVQVTDKVDPPVCKITDYGKYVYQQRKKEKSSKKPVGELKNIRVGFNTGQHDIDTKISQISKFLLKGNKIRIEMKLRGREKSMKTEAKEKLIKMLSLIGEKTPYKIEKDIKSEPRGLTVIISKK